MRHIQTDILVIGGGATGTGILRDLAMRGFKGILVEKRDLTHGTTGRFHGLLHSGGRYVVKDPSAARECMVENKILRHIMPECIEDTGGFFVLTSEDEPHYIEKFLMGCHNAEIPVEEVTLAEMLQKEPLLNPNILRCFHVPDAAVDSFAAAHANIASAAAYGAQALTYHEVIQLIKHNNRVKGAVCQDLIKDEQVTIHADLTINASGAWVGKIGATIGLDISIRPGKGTMLAVSHRVVNTVINRCKLPSDGDILVPSHTVAVIGTTDQQISDPDHFAIEPWEIQRMLLEGEKLVPGFKAMRMLRAWAGVRPLYQENRTNSSRDITRSIVLLDHEFRDSVTGLLTITGGKWTTYRKMAEITVDKICEKFGTERSCRTHSESLPAEDPYQPHKKFFVGTPISGYHLLGKRLAKIESQKTFGDLICECELVTRSDIENAIRQGNVFTLDDLRRDLRLGMGPCQGGFCTLRASGMINATIDSQVPAIARQNVAMHDFLQERWKGLLPVLWGKQLQQERLNELIYRNVLNIEELPGPTSSRLAVEPYQHVNWDSSAHARDLSQHHPVSLVHPVAKIKHRPIHTLVIGAGIAGLMAAWRMSTRGNLTQVIASGWGATHMGSGCIDVVGNDLEQGKAVKSPEKFISNITRTHPQHPYAQLELNQIYEAFNAFQKLCDQANYPIKGSLTKNWLLPTALGTFRPTCFAPETMVAGALQDSSPMLLVGFEGFHDFYPHMAAANLRSQKIPAKAITLELPLLQASRRKDSISLARLFQKEEFQNQVITALKPNLSKIARVGFPAVLGIKNSRDIHRALEFGLGRRVFEVAGLPPSIPGLRLHNILLKAVRSAGGRVFNGITACNSEVENERVRAVIYETASHTHFLHAQNFILASGGFLGGGIQTDHIGHANEMIFGLSMDQIDSFQNNFQSEFLHPHGHAIFRSGVRTQPNFKTVFENLFVIGSTLEGDFIHQRALEGVALVTGYNVGEHLS
ncbi:MAG: anaerobic glycerol-3-phosphate dehydrogenase subunit A [Anaerolineae bacterium]|nr:anaerobic glycerol-3-phosphate dehydrogenase subunit A [Anaerolineae bacterium]